MFEGHVVRVRRGKVLHYGVMRKDGTVVEHAGKDGGTGQVVQLKDFARGEAVEVLPRENPTISPAIAVWRAESIVANMSYSTLGFNCEHAATLAVNGRAQSEQAERILRMMAIGASAGALAGVKGGAKAAITGAAFGALAGVLIGYLTN